MIINEIVSSPVVSNVLTAPSRFKIKASAKAFKILSGFYSEPILAIPRELGANAWDSHVKAGNTSKMFEVHAPNHLEPWFAIRDFGTGLSPEAIDTIYTTYFESTKTGDNDSDGCMGLGSKTPFNYTDNFNVTSFHNGKKYVYNCFIDEQGAPNIMQIATTSTTEPNGLEVKFGVKITDIDMWIDKISRAYEPFRNRPIIKGAKIEFKPREYIYQGKNWAVRKNQKDDYYHNRGSNAFMGNYCYPINTDALRRTIYNLEKNNAYKLESALANGGFDFYFNIGDLEVAPNKEQLQYEENNSTSVVIFNALKAAIIELKQLVVTNMETPKNLWQAMRMYNKYNGYNSDYSNIRNIVGGEFPIKLNGTLITTGNESIHNVHKNSNALSQNGTVNTSFSIFQIDDLNGRIKRVSTYMPHADGRDNHIFYSKNTVKSTRLRHYLRTKYTDGKIPFCYVIVDSTPNLEIFNKHKAYFGWDDSMITDINSLPKPPATPRVKRISNTDEVMVADIEKFFNTIIPNQIPQLEFDRESHTFDSNGTYYYVEFSYNSFVDENNKECNKDILRDAICVAIDAKKLDAKTIYGINKKNKKLLKIGTWINLMQLVKKVVTSNKSKYEQHMFDINQRNVYNNFGDVRMRLEQYPSILTNIKNDKTREMFKAFIASRKKVFSKNYEHSPLMEFFNISAKNHSPDLFDIDAFKHAVETKYMNVFESVYSHGEHNELIYTFINLIDEKV